MELSDLYSERILDLAGNAPVRPRLSAPHASARKVSRICGSVVEVDVVVNDGRITAFGPGRLRLRLGQTSAAIVAREIEGTEVTEFISVRRAMHDMLKAGGAPPGGRWSDLGYLEPVRDYPARHASTLLVFEAVAAALEKLESDQRPAVAA